MPSPLLLVAPALNGHRRASSHGSVGALLRAVHAALALPTASGPLSVRLGSAAMVKQHFQVQRAWLSLLASFTASGLGEEAGKRT